MLNWKLAAGIALAGLSSCNTQTAVTENSQSPKPTITLQDIIPASQPASLEQKREQEKFVAQSAKQFKSMQLGATYYVAEAKRTFNEEKLDSATYLFGRAWLLDSTNQDIYWGYGLVYGQQKAYERSLFSLYKALEADAQNPRLLTDIATTHLGRFYEESNAEDLQQSKKLLEEAIKTAPAKADTYYKLAINCYYMREYGQAWDYLHKSIRQDKEVADQQFISALLQKQPDPLGKYSQEVE